MPEKILNPGWGLPVEAEAPAAWGARMIWQDQGYPDLLWDRQDMQGAVDDCKTLGEKLNAGAIKQFREHISNVCPGQDCEMGVFNIAGVECRFSTRGSHGYLYVTAFLRTEQKGKS